MRGKKLDKFAKKKLKSQKGKRKKHRVGGKLGPKRKKISRTIGSEGKPIFE